MAKYFGDRRAVEVQVEGARTGVVRSYRADRKGFLEVNNASDAKALKESGFVEASLMGVADAGTGRICENCGFNGFFKLCGRCGHETDDVQRPV